MDKFDLNILPGQVVAIVGHSGSGLLTNLMHSVLENCLIILVFSLYIGKSTVCSLLERFYDIDSGEIKIDGVDLRALSPAWLRSKALGYISQVLYLIHILLSNL